MDLFTENARRMKAQDIEARLQGIVDKFGSAEAVLKELTTKRAELLAGEQFNEADVAAFDAKVDAAAGVLLGRLKAALNRTVTLKDRVTIQVDGREV